MPRSSRAACHYLVTHSTYPTLLVLVKRTGRDLLPDPNVTEEQERDREAERRCLDFKVESKV